jgi:hypothetical protein
MNNKNKKLCSIEVPERCSTAMVLLMHVAALSLQGTKMSAALLGKQAVLCGMAKNRFIKTKATSGLITSLFTLVRRLS